MSLWMQACDRTCLHTYLTMSCASNFQALEYFA